MTIDSLMYVNIIIFYFPYLKLPYINNNPKATNKGKKEVKIFIYQSY